MNPNFKPHMITKKLLKACGDQVNKYFYGPMDSDCEFCKAMPRISFGDYTDYDCSQCPLGDGESRGCPCVTDKTFIDEGRRETASKKQLLARGNRLIEILDQHGITIYDKEVK